MINKKSMIDRLSEELSVSKKEAREFLNTFQDIVIEEVSKGNNVKLSGFAAFSPVERKARVMRHPRTGDPLEVPAHTAVTVKPYKAFRDAVRG